MVTGFMVATLAKRAINSVAGFLLSLLSMFAILTTFTRSMLSSALLVIGLFFIFILACRREMRSRWLVMFSSLGLLGLAFVVATGMQDIWIGRMSLLGTIPKAAVTMISSAAKAEMPKADADVKSDFNVTLRFEEYRIAWKMFLAHPLLGNGLGVKHPMRWIDSAGNSIPQFVAYIHNWPLYILMVSGVTGLLFYLLVLFGPALSNIYSIGEEPMHWSLIRAMILTMSIYGLFFAVFRLITFNLLLAAAWGVVIAHDLTRRLHSGKVSGGKMERLCAFSEIKVSERSNIKIVGEESANANIE
jgi:hypothetical protein